MGEWDCPECGMSFYKMLTPVDYRSKTFCSKECLDSFKARPHRKARAEYHVSHDRSPSMGKWERKDSRLWEDSREAR
jgi:YHS domain-containing protein